MKKHTLLTFALIFCLFLSAQTNNTGVVTLSGSIGYTVDVKVSSTDVVLDIVGPSGGYLGLAFGVSSMTTGGDVLVYQGISNQISDMTFDGFSAPILDTTQEWTATTTDDGTTVTIQATRPLVSATGGYVFSPTDTSIILAWSHRPGNYSLGYHGGGSNRGATTAGLTLSAPTFQVANQFSIFPNPGIQEMNIKIPDLINEGLELDVFDVLGKKIYSKNVSQLNTKINITSWNSGLYFVRLISTNKENVLTKLFVKQ